VNRRVAAAVGAVGVVALWAVVGAVAHEGLPFGVVLYGIILGSLNGLTAMGIVLVYRSTRIINFAQAELGALAVTVAFVMKSGWHVNYWLSAAVGLLVAVGTGALVERTIVHRLFLAPRLILTVATIGLLDIIASAEIEIPRRFGHLDPLQRFHSPFTFNHRVGPIVITGDHVVALIVVPLAVAAMAVFLTRSGAGLAVRAAADAPERAVLLGIPVRRLSLLAWTVAAALSGVAALLSAPILGPHIGFFGGPPALLAPLAAAIVARLESMPTALVAAVAFGIVEQSVFWIWSRSSAVDVVLFAVILGALLLQRRRLTRVDESGLGGHDAVREVRPIPDALARLPVVRWSRRALAGVLLAVALVAPLLLPDARVIRMTYTLLYGIVAISLVVLTGWAGQISLGQFAFVGIGAAVTGSLLVHAGADLFVAMLASTATGALAAVVIGVPALRIRGLLLAATTLAFAVPVSTWLLNSLYFPTFTPRDVPAPTLIERFSLETWRTLYFVCLGAFLVVLALARNLRRTRAGRVLLAVRDNERAAAVVSIDPTRTKLTAFAFSGAIAGLAGGLYVVAQRGIGFNGFDPRLSIEVFTAAVVGGLGSLPGALLGAAFVQWAQQLHGGARLLASGGGLLVVLLVVPGGLGEVVFRIRDRLLRVVARRHDLPPVVSGSEMQVRPRISLPETSPGREGALVCDGIVAGYGALRVLDGVDIGVGDGEIAALLGTNGAGKSTLLRVVGGLLAPTRGRVVFRGRDITDTDPAERVRAGIVTVPGGRGVFGSLTVAQNLRLARWLRRHDRDATAAATEGVLERFPQLRRRIDEPASSLSGGEQQMLTLAQALLCEPELLLVDELSLGLAPAVVAGLLDVLRALNAAGTTVVVVEQSVNVASTIASRAVFLEKGTVGFEGATAELLDRPDLLRSVLLGTARERAVAAASAPSPNGHAHPNASSHLELIGIAKRFGGVTAIDGVDLRAPAGSIVGIIGANGAGKTTLFDICSGFLRPDAGRVVLDGVDITTTSPAERAALGLGRSFQDARLFPTMTVTDAVAVAMERHVEVRDPLLCALHTNAVLESERAIRRRVDDLLELFNLGKWRTNFVGELSTGTRRVVDLACAMALEPRVLLLDEPSSGIAQRESEALADLLLALRRDTGAALVVIEHDIPLVASIADELVCLALGQVIARGEPAAVLEHPAVIESYLGTDEATVLRSRGAAPRRRTPRKRTVTKRSG